MNKIPVKIDYNRKLLIWGFSSHEIGNHLSIFINFNYRDFYLSRNAIYGHGEICTIDDETTFNKINEFFKTLFYVCFSDTFLYDIGIKPESIKEANKIFTPQRRYWYFSLKNKGFQDSLNISYNIDFNFYNTNLTPKNVDISKLLNIVGEIKDPFLVATLQYEPGYVENVVADNFQSLLFLEFIKILEMNLPIKQCKNCGKYFIPKGRSDSLYCDYLYLDTRKTCSEIGISKTYKERINKSEIHKSYNRYYKKMYARCLNRKIDNKTFSNWVEKATKERDIAIKKIESLKINSSKKAEIENLFIDFLKALSGDEIIKTAQKSKEE